MFSFISVSGSCRFLKYLGTVQETYQKEKRDFFYSGTDSFNIRNKPSVDYNIQIYAADASGMTRLLDYSGVIGSSSRQKNVHIIKGVISDILEIGSNLFGFQF